jgi:hypothetical protein
MYLSPIKYTPVSLFIPDSAIDLNSWKVALCLQLNRPEELRQCLMQQMMLADEGKLTRDQLSNILLGKENLRLVRSPSGLEKAIEEGNTESIAVLLAHMVEAAHKGLITCRQFTCLIAAWRPEGRPAMHLAMDGGGKISLYGEPKAELIRTYMDCLCRASELGLVDSVTLTSLLLGRPYPEPPLAVAFRHGEAHRVDAYLERVLDAGRRGLVSPDGLLAILAALLPDGSCGINVAMRRGSNGPIRSYLNRIMNAAREKIIDADRLERLFQPCEGAPALMESVMSGNREATRIFMDAMVAAAHERLIHPGQLLRLLQATGADGASILRVAIYLEDEQSVEIILECMLAGARRGLIDPDQLRMLMEDCPREPVLHFAMQPDKYQVLLVLLEQILCAAREHLIDGPSLVLLLRAGARSQNQPALWNAMESGTHIATGIYLERALAARRENLISSQNLMTLFHCLSTAPGAVTGLWQAMALDHFDVVVMWLNRLKCAAEEKFFDAAQLVDLLGFRDKSVPEAECCYQIALRYFHQGMADCFAKQVKALQDGGYLSKDDVDRILGFQDG